MKTRFGSLKFKGKIVKQAVRACLWAPGRFRTRAGSSPCAFQASRRQSQGFVSSGGFWGRGPSQTETGSFET